MLDQIARCHVCRYLQKDQISILIDSGTVRQANKGTWICQEGDAGDSMFAIVSGAVSIQKRDPDGTNKALTIIGPGDTLGEMSLIDGHPRSASALAFEDSTLFQVTRAQLVSLVKKRPDISSRLLWAIVETISMRLRQTEGLYQAMLARALTGVEKVPKAGI